MALLSAAQRSGLPVSALPSLPPCGGAGLQELESEVAAKLDALTPAKPLLVVAASTGSGKSKWLPSFLAAQSSRVLVAALAQQAGRAG